MCRIAEKMREDDENPRSGMYFGNMEKAADEIDALGRELGLSPTQVVLLTAIMRKDSASGIGPHILANSIGINYLKLLTYHNEFEDLRRKGYIRIDKKGFQNDPQQPDYG